MTGICVCDLPSSRLLTQGLQHDRPEQGRFHRQRGPEGHACFLRSAPYYNFPSPLTLCDLPSTPPFLYTGQEPNDPVVDGMMSEAPGPLNFTMFLTLFGEKLTGELGCPGTQTNTSDPQRGVKGGMQVLVQWL